MSKKNVCLLIIQNTDRFKYYIIQQLFNDVKVPRCHTENLSFENIFIPFKYSLLFFHGFMFWGTNIKGTISSGRVRSHPSHPSQLRGCKIKEVLKIISLCTVSISF